MNAVSCGFTETYIFSFIFHRSLHLRECIATFAENEDRMNMIYRMPQEKCFCLQCGQPIELGSGRQDRKFCSVACKNKYHNAGRQMLSRHYKNKVIRILDNNNFILRRLLSMGVTSLDVNTLRQMQFNFDFSSSYHKIGRRQLYTCFDVQYELTPTRIMNIRDLLERDV